MESVDPNNFRKLLENKKNVSLVPGGFEEATLTTNNEYRLFIRNRKGFIKYAMKYGYKIYPVFIFKESTYNTIYFFYLFIHLLIYYSK